MYCTARFTPTTQPLKQIARQQKYHSRNLGTRVVHLSLSSILQMSCRVATASEPEERNGYPFSLNSVVPQYSRSSGS